MPEGAQADYQRAVRRLLAPTALSLVFVTAPGCGKKEEEKKDAAAKSAEATPAADAAKDAVVPEATPTEPVVAEKEEPAPPAAAGDAAILELVPDAAKIVAVVSLSDLMGTALYKGQAATIENSPFGKNILAARACNLDLPTWKQVVVASDPTAPTDAIMAGMAATGVGTKENIECIAGKYREEDPRADWKVEEKDGRVVVTIDGGEMMAYSAGDDTLVMVSQPWDAAVLERLKGEGTPAVTGSLKEPLTLVDRSKFVYVAGIATPDMATGPAAGAEHFGASFDFGERIALNTAISFGDPEKAKAKATELDTQFQGVKGMAAGFGIPQALVDSVKIEAKDHTVTVALSATVEEIEQTVKAVMGAMFTGGPR